MLILKALGDIQRRRESWSKAITNPNKANFACVLELTQMFCNVLVGTVGGVGEIEFGLDIRKFHAKTQRRKVGGHSEPDFGGIAGTAVGESGAGWGGQVSGAGVQCIFVVDAGRFEIGHADETPAGCGENSARAFKAEGALDGYFAFTLARFNRRHSCQARLPTPRSAPRGPLTALCCRGGRCSRLRAACRRGESCCGQSPNASFRRSPGPRRGGNRTVPYPQDPTLPRRAASSPGR